MEVGPGQLNSGLGPTYGGGIEPTATTATARLGSRDRRVVWRAGDTGALERRYRLRRRVASVFQGHIDGNFPL